MRDPKNRIISEVWSLAEKAVSKAEEIVFIGYSMPADDFEIKSMLLRAIADHSYRHGENNKTRIMVIGKKPENFEEKKHNDVQKRNFKALSVHLLSTRNVVLKDIQVVWSK